MSKFPSGTPPSLPTQDLISLDLRLVLRKEVPVSVFFTLSAPASGRAEPPTCAGRVEHYPRSPGRLQIEGSPIRLETPFLSQHALPHHDERSNHLYQRIVTSRCPSRTQRRLCLRTASRTYYLFKGRHSGESSCTYRRKMPFPFSPIRNVRQESDVACLAPSFQQAQVRCSLPGAPRPCSSSSGLCFLPLRKGLRKSLHGKAWVGCLSRCSGTAYDSKGGASEGTWAWFGRRPAEAVSATCCSYRRQSRESTADA